VFKISIGKIIFGSAVFLLSCGLLLAASVPIRNIQVDVQGKTALDAREMALAKARQLAFTRLVSENPTYGISASDGVPPADILEALVDDYEVVAEKMSNVRYVGTFNINFNERALQKYLKGSRRLVNPDGQTAKQDSSGASMVSAEKIVIIPIYISPDTSFLWEESNPWTRHWVKFETQAKGKMDRYNFTVPLGDLKDIMVLTIEDAITSKGQKINSLMERYQAEVALIPILKSLDDGINSHELQFKTFSKAGLQQATEPIILQGQRGVILDDIMKTATKKVAAALNGKVSDDKMQNAIVDNQLKRDMPLSTEERALASEQSSNLKVTANFRTFQDWQAIRQSLSKSDLIDGVDVLNLTRQQADLFIKSRGSLSALKAKLAALGVKLDHDGGRARLSLAQSTPSPQPFSKPVESRQFSSIQSEHPEEVPDSFSIEEDEFDPPEVIE
jgi:hypothetical protein